MTLKIAIEKMRADAVLWQGASDVCGTAAGAVRGLTLSEVDLCWASSETGVLASYQEILTKAERLLNEGKTVYSDLSKELNHVAGEYERSDESASKQFKDVWVPRR